VFWYKIQVEPKTDVVGEARHISFSSRVIFAFGDYQDNLVLAFDRNYELLACNVLCMQLPMIEFAGFAQYRRR
jgi:hypothetical protein